MKTRIGLIWAQGSNGVIGREGQMPWHLPEDLTHFKTKTMGCPVIMGRKTWDSIPERFRPLPGRRNIVVTRTRNWQSRGAEVANSIEEAMALCEDTWRSWVIGGAQIYAQSAKFANIIIVTEIDKEFLGDAYAPEIDMRWSQTNATEWQISQTGLRYRFVTYERSRDFDSTHADFDATQS